LKALIQKEPLTGKKKRNIFEYLLGGFLLRDNRGLQLLEKWRHAGDHGSFGGDIVLAACRVALKSGDEVTIPRHWARAMAVIIVVSNEEEGMLRGKLTLALQKLK
jgi:hypothetical protein